MNTTQKMTIARTQLILDHPFFGSLAMRLQFVERADIGTLAVDGTHVFYNPEYVNSLSMPLLRAAIAHEVLHCVYEHMARVGERNPRKFNVAADYVVNQTLKDSGFELSPDWLYNSSLGQLSTDEVYNRLPDDDNGSGEQSQDQVMPSTTAQQTHGSSASDWKVAAVQAAQAAKSMGRLPGAIARFIDELLGNQVDWREQLRQFINQRAKDDYAWSKPNRRFVHMGLVLPSMYSERMGDIVVAIDTSGSVGNHELAAFAAEIKAIVDSARPSSTHVVYCDAAVNHVDVYSPNDEVLITPHGGGGTDFCPVFDYVQANNIQPECLVYLTDLYGRFPQTAPDYPTLWVSTTPAKHAPFGETLELRL